MAHTNRQVLGLSDQGVSGVGSTALTARNGRGECLGSSIGLSLWAARATAPYVVLRLACSPNSRVLVFRPGLQQLVATAKLLATAVLCLKPQLVQ